MPLTLFSTIEDAVMGFFLDVGCNVLEDDKLIEFEADAFSASELAAKIEAAIKEAGLCP